MKSCRGLSGFRIFFVLLLAGTGSCGPVKNSSLIVAAPPSSSPSKSKEPESQAKVTDKKGLSPETQGQEGSSGKKLSKSAEVLESGNTSELLPVTGTQNANGTSELPNFYVYPIHPSLFQHIHPSIFQLRSLAEQNLDVSDFCASEKPGSLWYDNRSTTGTIALCTYEKVRFSGLSPQLILTVDSQTEEHAGVARVINISPLKVSQNTRHKAHEATTLKVILTTGKNRHLEVELTSNWDDTANYLTRMMLNSDDLTPGVHSFSEKPFSLVVSATNQYTLRLKFKDGEEHDLPLSKMSTDPNVFGPNFTATTASEVREINSVIETKIASSDTVCNDEKKPLGTFVRYESLAFSRFYPLFCIGDFDKKALLNKFFLTGSLAKNLKVSAFKIVRGVEEMPYVIFHNPNTNPATQGSIQFLIQSPYAQRFWDFGYNSSGDYTSGRLNGMKMSWSAGTPGIIKLVFDDQTEKTLTLTDTGW